MLETAGRFLFRTRNVVFPVVFGSILACFPPAAMGLPREWWLLGPGLGLVLAGQSLRAATIGLCYIKRGGRGKRPYANDLVTGGVFAHCRNPMYLGNGLILVGMLMVAGNPAGIAAGALFAAAAYGAIVAGEERYLSQRFGVAYEEYRSRVPRWLPRLRGLGRTLRERPLDWRTVLVKEYGTLYLSVLLPAGIIAWKALRAADPGRALPALAAALGVIALATAGYSVLRWLKLSGRLTAGASVAPSTDLARSRAAIDEIDAAILGLLSRRAVEVSAVFAAKDRRGVPRYDPLRSQEIVQRLRRLNAGPLTDEQVGDIFGFILHLFAFEYDLAAPAPEPPRVAGAAEARLASMSGG